MRRGPQTLRRSAAGGSADVGGRRDPRRRGRHGVQHALRKFGPTHRRLRDPLGRSRSEHSLRHDGPGSVGSGPGHRSRNSRRHRGPLVARAAQRAEQRERIAMPGFGARLADALSRRGPLCLGIDPHPELLRAWNLPVSSDGLAAFCDICVAAYTDFAIVKPQVAFFETYGAAGYAVLERTMAALRDAGVLVLADAKRGDIGSTMAAYAAAWTGDSPLAADAVTASPYLGFGSLQPLLEAAAAHDRGVFVVAASSNPEGATVQRAAFDGRTVAQLIVDQAALVNREANRSATGTESGDVGVVVGATAFEV